MSVDLSGEITAIATAVLAVFAIVTAWYARRAFLKQSQEVRDQAEMLNVQSGQLAEQRRINELQAEELRDSLAERARQRRLAEREQADAVSFAWWPASHALIANPAPPPPPDMPRHPVALTPADTSGMSMLVVDNASRRRILNAECRIEPSEGSGLTLAAERTGLLADPLPLSSAHRAMTDYLTEGSTVSLIRPSFRYGFLLRFDLEKNPDARLAVRFTDDAGLHWQIDQDLHLRPLDNRDDW